MVHVPTLGILLWRTEGRRAGFQMPYLGNREATNMGREVLLDNAGYYRDFFDGRCCGFYMPSLGFSRFFFSFCLVRITETEKYSFPSKGSKERQQLEDLLRKYGKLQEVVQLDTTALHERIQGREWEPEVIKAVEKYVELEMKKRLWLSKMKE